MNEQQQEVAELHALAQKLVTLTEKDVPDDCGIIVITFKRKPETMTAIASTVVADLAMQIIDHCAHSDVNVVSVEGHDVPHGTPMPGTEPLKQ